MGLFDAYSSKKPTDSANTSVLPATHQAQAASPVLHTSPLAKAIEAGPQGAGLPGDKPGFLKSHFGNPEAGEVYGVGNDYETEAEQTKDEKRTASQAIWFLGAFGLCLLVVYLIFGL